MNTKNLPQLSLSLVSYSSGDPGGWSRMFASARAADAVGVDRLVVGDHVVFGERLEEYGNPETGGQAGGQQPTGPDGHWLEPMTTLAVVAGMTSQIRLRAHILLAALRRPVVLAKSAATLDVLSDGRFDLGIGVGWQRAEYEAAGLPFEGRGRLLDHTMEVCHTLWRERRATYQSPELKFENIHQMPKPLRPAGVPIWVSGTNRTSTIRRLATWGARWLPWGPDAANLKESIPRVKQALSQLGRPAEFLEVTDYLPMLTGRNGDIDLARTMEPVPERLSWGVTDFVCEISLPPDQSAAEDKLRPVVAAFRSAAGRAQHAGEFGRYAT
jgi:probable F420-dependent oxidoreductase